MPGRDYRRRPWQRSSTDAATVGYAVEGAVRAPLLLFHGTTMDRAGMGHGAGRRCPADYQFVMVEFPGSGESSMPTAD